MSQKRIIALDKTVLHRSKSYEFRFTNTIFINPFYLYLYLYTT